MMKGSISILVLLTLLLSACGDSGAETEKEEGADSQAELSSAKVHGTMLNAAGKTLVLERWKADGAIEVVDKTIIAEDGTYALSTPLDMLEYYRLHVEPAKQAQDFVNLFIEKDDNIKLSANATNMLGSVEVEGSEHTQVMVSYFQDVVLKDQALMDSLRIQTNALPFDAKEERGVLMKRIEEIKGSKAEEVNSFLAQHGESPVAFFMLQERVNESRFSGDGIQEADIELLKVSRDNIIRLMPNTYIANYADASVSSYEEDYRASLFLRKGTEAPEIVMNDLDGKERKLSDLRGKVVLLDFWASWCRPCRAANPTVVASYNKYRSAGFDVFSVSLDRDQAAWANAVKQDQLAWNNHVSDLQQWNNAAAALYNVTAIPFTVLLDKEGNVLAKGEAIHGNNLPGKLQEIFGF